MVNRLALVLSVAVVKPCMVLVDFHYLLLLRAIRCRGGNRSVYIVRPEVESAQRHQRYFRIETKALEADGGDLITVLIESGSLWEEVVQIRGWSCRSSHLKRNQADTAGGLRMKGKRKTRRRCWQMPAVINTFFAPEGAGAVDRVLDLIDLIHCTANVFPSPCGDGSYGSIWYSSSAAAVCGHYEIRNSQFLTLFWPLFKRLVSW